jgi:DNA-binding Lrp family transcriptional regulator
LWAEEETRLNALPPKAGQVLEAVLYRGELPRGEVSELLGLTTRHARRIVATLLERGVLTSEGSILIPAKVRIVSHFTVTAPLGLFFGRSGDT